MTVQLFCYPEDAVLTGPDRLCELAASLGADALAVAVRYHASRRWFPRHGIVSHSPGGITYFRPGGYRRLRPMSVAGEEAIAAVHALRAVAPRHGLGFHAWMVLLHDDPVVAAYPDAAAQTIDGTPTVHALCPSHPDVVEYAAALVADVCDQFAPDVIELESAFYPAWHPSYTLSLELTPAPALTGQCLCRFCRELGADPAEPAALPAVRARGAERVMTAMRQAARETRLRPLFFGGAESAALQGAGPAALALADGVGIGCGIRTGAPLTVDFRAMAALADDRPLLASINWSPKRDGRTFAADVRAVIAAGASDIALYNLSLVPADGLDDLAMAARAAHAAATGS